MSVVIARTVLGTLEGSEGSLWGYSMLLDDVYFGKVYLVIQICSFGYSTVEFGSPSAGKHTFGVVSGIQTDYFNLGLGCFIGLVLWQVSYTGIRVGESSVPGPRRHEHQSCMNLNGSLSVAYVNAEGKANNEHQIRVILDTVRKRLASSWLFIAVSEADYRCKEEYETSQVDNHFVERYHIAGGRAAKVIWNVRCQKLARDVVWSNRSCRIDLDLTSCLDGSLISYAKCSIVFSHLAHGDSWWDSFDDLNLLLSNAPVGHSRYVLGDLNVEGRVSVKNDEDRDKWAHMLLAIEAVNLSSGIEIDDLSVTRRPRGLSALPTEASCIDHCFVLHHRTLMGLLCGRKPLVTMHG